MDELSILKAKAYDILAQIEYLRGQLTLANSEIARLSEAQKKSLTGTRADPVVDTE